MIVVSAAGCAVVVVVVVSRGAGTLGHEPNAAVWSQDFDPTGMSPEGLVLAIAVVVVVVVQSRRDVRARLCHALPTLADFLTRDALHSDSGVT